MPRPAPVALAVLLAAAPSLASAAVAVPAEGQAQEGGGFIVPTPWDVRRDVSELINDLDRRQARRLAVPALLDRVQRLLEQNGHLPVFDRTAYRPIAQVVAQALERSGLTEAWREHAGPLAARRLADLGGAASGDTAALAALVAAFPGTTAAAEAARRLADLAWDRGHLGRYVACARAAGDAAAGGERAQRLRAALDLLASSEPAPLPARLDGLERAWVVGDLPAPPRARRGLGNDLVFEARDGGVRGAPPGLTFARSGELVAAASDGTTLVLFDPLVGSRIGDPLRLGAAPLPTAAQAPCWAGDRFVAVGLGNDLVPVLTAVSGDGRLLWRAGLKPDHAGMQVSAPAATSGVVAVAVTVSTEGGSELRLVGFDLATGRPRFDRLIGKNPPDLRHRMIGGGQAPALCVHQGCFAVLSNSGALARLDAEGGPLDLWTYGGGAPASELEAMAEATALRPGVLLSDGRFLVASPADGRDLLVLGPDDAAPRRWAGTGSGDPLADVAGGRALLAGRRVTLLSLDGTLDLRWSVEGFAEGWAFGRLGADGVLAGGERQLRLHDLADGATRSSMALDPRERIGLASGYLLSARTRTDGDSEVQDIVGFGDPRGFERLLAAIQAAPDDPRPLLGLAAHHRSRQQDEAAYDCLLKALRLGAPPRHAAEAARLATRRLQVALGDAATFAPALARLEALTPWLERVDGELAFWKGRHAELLGDPAGATAAFARLSSAEGGIIFPSGLEVRLDALAALSLARLGAAAPPDWLAGPSVPAAPGLTTTWTSADRLLGRPLVAGGRVIAYAGGDLRCWDLADGREVWRRSVARGDDGLLGVRLADRAALAAGPVRVVVIPGTAADAAGLHDNDLLTRINGQAITTFQDLINIVAGIGPGGELAIEVRRDDEQGGEREVTCRGRLGSFMMEPVAAQGRVLLVRRMTVRESGALWRVVPDHFHKPAIELYDLETGALLLHRDLPKGGLERLGAPPQLIPTGHCLLAESDGLSAWDPRRVVTDGPAAPAWTAAIGPGPLQCDRLGPWLSAVGSLDDPRLRLLHLGTGSILASLPAPAAPGLVRHGAALYQRGGDGALGRLDLDLGLRRWRSAEAGELPLAATADGVYVRDADGRLRLLDAGNGRLRCRYGEFTQIHSAVDDGATLFLHAQTDEQTQVLAAVGLSGGSVLWQIPLPEGLEVRGGLQAYAGGLAAVLFDGAGDGPAALAVDRQGRIALAAPLTGDGDLTVGDGVLLASGRDGLRLLAASAPPAREALACPALAVPGDLADAVSAAMARLAWTPVGDSRVALARTEGDLLVVVAPGPKTNRLEVHLGDAGPAIDPSGQRVVCERGKPAVLTRRPGQWQVVKTAEIQGPGPGDVVHILRLLPPPGRDPAARLLVHPVAVPDEAGPPWWLRAAWRPVRFDGAPATPPPPAAP